MKYFRFDNLFATFVCRAEDYATALEMLEHAKTRWHIIDYETLKEQRDELQSHALIDDGVKETGCPRGYIINCYTIPVEQSRYTPYIRRSEKIDKLLGMSE